MKRIVVISRGRTLPLFVVVTLGIWALAATNTKAALQPGCTLSKDQTTVTCSYTQQGQQASFVVPADVTSVKVYATGGTGGDAGGGVRHPVGAPGAVVTGSLSVSPGSVLSIQVAGDGSTGPGAGGGGAGCTGGGGASRVSTSSGPLLVAAGGGGDGCYGSGGGGGMFGLVGGYGGNAGLDGGTSAYGNAGGGAAGTPSAGGAGGTGGTGSVNGTSGAAGSAGTGGDGGNGATGAGAAGGGGGGGLFGGGGGGQGATHLSSAGKTTDPGGGGGGGSSLVPPGGSYGLNSAGPPGPTIKFPMVVISYTAPPSPPPGTVVPPGSPGSNTIPQSAARVNLTSLSQSHARWRRGSKLPQFASVARVRKPPIGTTFRFKLSGPASVRFAFTQSHPGRRVGRRCVAVTASNRRKRRCRRTITAGSFKFSAGAGAYSVRFQGRVSRSKKLKPGRYTLIITATNTAGSTSAKLTFTIVG